MLTIIQNINPIIIDTVVVCVFVLILFLGYVRGIKKVSIDMGVVLVSFLLGFSSATNSLKKIVAEKILVPKNWLPAGSSKSLTLAASLASAFIASLAIFLLFYLLLTVIKTLIVMLINKKTGKSDNDSKSVTSRLCGLFVSLIYQVGLIIFLLVSVNTDMMGGKAVFQKTTVTNWIVNTVEDLGDKIGEEVLDVTRVKLAKGDVFAKVDDNLLFSYQDIESIATDVIAKKDYITILDDETLTKEESTEMIKTRIINLRAISILYKEFDVLELAGNDFSKVCEEWFTSMNRLYLNKQLTPIEFTLNEHSEIRLSFTKAKVNDTLLGVFDEITATK